jgi:general secretion pathway protein C
MAARWWTLAVWALAAGSALFWGLKLVARPTAVPAQTQVAEPGAGLRGDLGRVFGNDAPPAETVAAAPAADARYALLGVVSPRAPNAAREGVALIAVDGKPAKAFRVGAVVDGEQLLKAVHARGATLGPREGGTPIALNIAPPAPAAQGTLPVAVSGGAAPARFDTPSPPQIMPAPRAPRRRGGGDANAPAPQPANPPSEDDSSVR